MPVLSAAVSVELAEVAATSAEREARLTLTDADAVGDDVILMPVESDAVSVEAADMLDPAVMPVEIAAVIAAATTAVDASLTPVVSEAEREAEDETEAPSTVSDCCASSM